MKLCPRLYPFWPCGSASVLDIYISCSNSKGGKTCIRDVYLLLYLEKRKTAIKCDSLYYLETPIEISECLISKLPVQKMGSRALANTAMDEEHT